MIGLWIFSRLLIDMYFELLESTDIFNGIKKRNANVICYVLYFIPFL